MILRVKRSNEQQLTKSGSFQLLHMPSQHTGAPLQVVEHRPHPVILPIEIDMMKKVFRQVLSVPTKLTNHSTKM